MTFVSECVTQNLTINDVDCASVGLPRRRARMPLLRWVRRSGRAAENIDENAWPVKLSAQLSEATGPRSDIIFAANAFCVTASRAGSRDRVRRRS